MLYQSYAGKVISRIISDLDRRWNEPGSICVPSGQCSKVSANWISNAIWHQEPYYCNVIRRLVVFSRTYVRMLTMSQHSPSCTPANICHSPFRGTTNRVGGTCVHCDRTLAATKMYKTMVSFLPTWLIAATGSSQYTLHAIAVCSNLVQIIGSGPQGMSKP